MDTMMDHLGITCSDLPGAAAFYDVVLGTLGHRRIMDVGVAIGYGTSAPAFWISAQPESGPVSGPNREIRVAFSAQDATQVRSFFETAVAAGAEVLHEPRLRPEYHADYFAAFVRDPDTQQRGGRLAPGRLSGPHRPGPSGSLV